METSSKAFATHIREQRWIFFPLLTTPVLPPSPLPFPDASVGGYKRLPHG